MFIEPVSGKNFFGREEVLGTLHKRVTSLKGGYRQNMALSGPMLCGKSSILRYFLNNIDDPKVIPLYIDLDGIDFKMFCNRFIATLLYNYLKSIGQSEDSDLAVLIKASRNKIPVTVEKIDNVLRCLKKRRLVKAYEALLEITSVFKLETGKNCVVIFDEFHNLSNFQIKKPFQIFGKYIMIQKNTMYIVSSSQKTLLKEILSRKLSLLFGNFEIIDVDGFDNQTACSFVSQKSGGLGSRSTIKDYFIQLSEGNPFYLEVFATMFEATLQEIQESGSREECFFEALSQILYESDSILYQYFSNSMNFFLEKSTRKKFLPIILSLAKGNNTIKTLKKDLGGTEKNISLKLQFLQSIDIIYSCGMFYKLTDKMFEFWVKYVYSLKVESMVDDLDIKYLEFKDSVSKDYRNYCEANSRGVLEVIYDLFMSFKNEKIEINSKGRKLPEFNKIDKKMSKNNLFQLIADIDNKKWLCIVKENDIADETDINKLAAIKTKDGRKVIRKIFIPLKGIEQNAFLLAKEQNVWIWDVKQLNKLLRLYGKYEIVL